MTTTRWTTVFEGVPGQAGVLRAMLEADGLTTFVPDETTKLVDPFITGVSPLLATVQVPEDQVARARELLADGGARPTPGATAGDDDDAALIDAKLNAYVLPSILFTVLGLTAPLALITGWYYLKACERYERRARLHVVILLCLAASLLVLSVFGWLLLFGPREATYPV